jgi:hypothetical protein
MYTYAGRGVLLERIAASLQGGGAGAADFDAIVQRSLRGLLHGPAA